MQKHSQDVKAVQIRRPLNRAESTYSSNQPIPKVPFPLSWSGAFRVPLSANANGSVPSILAAIQQALRDWRAKDFIHDYPNENKAALSFQVPFDLFGNNWSILAAVNRGNIIITIDAAVVTVCYQIMFGRLVIIVTACLSWLGVIAISESPHWVGVVFVCTAWLAMAGINYALTVARFRIMLKEVVRSTVNTRGLRIFHPSP